MAETTNKIVREEALTSALQAVRAKVYTRNETDAKIEEKIEAIPAYELPVASNTKLGGVKAGGTGISIAADGTISATGEAAVNPDALPLASKTAKGAIIVGDGLDMNSGKLSVNFKEANDYTDTKVSDEIAKVIGGAPEALDTLKEIADYLDNDSDTKAGLVQQIAKKLDTATYNADKAVADKAVADNTAAIAQNASDITALQTATSDAELQKKYPTLASFNTLSGKVTANETAIAKKADKSYVDDNFVTAAELEALTMTAAEATAIVNTIFA